MRYKLKRIIRAYAHKERLKIDLILSPNWLSTSQLIRKETFTTQSSEELHAFGYRKCKGLYDNILWMGIPVYVRIVGGHIFDTSSNEYSKDTAVTLHDAMTSDATTSFIKSMVKGQIGTMDVQKLLFIGGIAAAAIIGMKVLGVF